MRAPLGKHMHAPEGSSRNVRHEEPMGIRSWDRDCERFVGCRLKLTDIGAVGFRAVDHDAVFAVHRHFFLPQSSPDDRPKLIRTPAPPVTRRMNSITKTVAFSGADSPRAISSIIA